MKKIPILLVLVLLASSVILITACQKKDINNEINNDENIIITSTESVTTELHSEMEATSQTEAKDIDVGGATLTIQKYRLNYYDVPVPFADLVKNEDYNKWSDEVLSENPNITNEMVMKRYIEDFNISREDFDKANIEWAIIIRDRLERDPVIAPLDYANQEAAEVYNADILYTLDDAVINEYYLSPEYTFFYESEFEEAVENDGYVPKTPVWIDVDQMEADFIAKYGHPSQMTEIETVITEVLEEVSKAAEALR